MVFAYLNQGRRSILVTTTAKQTLPWDQWYIINGQVLGNVWFHPREYQTYRKSIRRLRRSVQAYNLRKTIARRIAIRKTLDNCLPPVLVQSVLSQLTTSNRRSFNCVGFQMKDSEGGL